MSGMLTSPLAIERARKPIRGTVTVNGAVWRTEYAAYAAAHCLSPSQMRVFDRLRWPGGLNAGVMTWDGASANSFSDSSGFPDAMAMGLAKALAMGIVPVPDFAEADQLKGTDQPTTGQTKS